MDQAFADTLMEMQFFLGLEQCCTGCPSDLCIYKCLLNAHQHLPLHRVKVCYTCINNAETDYPQVSNGLFLQPSSLAVLGLKVHLNHQGRSCASNTGPNIPFKCITVVDISGIHWMNTVYCACKPDGKGIARWQQLLQHGFYPSTTDRIHSVFTLEVLKFFHVSLYFDGDHFSLIYYRL
jgi:hypothetical protein